VRVGEGCLISGNPLLGFSWSHADSKLCVFTPPLLLTDTSSFPIGGNPGESLKTALVETTLVGTLVPEKGTSCLRNTSSGLLLTLTGILLLPPVKHGTFALLGTIS